MSSPVGAWRCSRSTWSLPVVGLDGETKSIRHLGFATEYRWLDKKGGEGLGVHVVGVLGAARVTFWTSLEGLLAASVAQVVSQGGVLLQLW